MASITRVEAEIEVANTGRRVMPGGGFGNLSHDIVIREGRGGRVWDMSGNRYVDFLLGSGPMLIGHAHPDVTAAVQAQLARGTTFFANNEHGIRLAEAVVEAVPCADQVRFTSSGSEATHYCMRLARAFTQRSKIMKFEGGFHGMGDWALMSMAPKHPGNFPQATPDSAGIPEVLTGEMLIAPFNDAEAATALIESHKADLAGVIVEPQQRLIPPRPGFLEALRRATAAHGIPLIFDEVVTGFRHAYGGAQEYYGVVPDLCALGKAVGGGFPLAAVAGRGDLMAMFDRSVAGDIRFTPQIGTLSGNPVAAAAGLATLNVLRTPGTYPRLFETGRRLMEGLGAAMRKAGHTAQIVGEPPMFEVFFTERPIHNYRDVITADMEKLKRFNRLLLERGVLKGDTKFYVSTAHDEADVAQTLDAFADAAIALR
ncbi:MAG: aminotransferase class III-fold pyridoxal phosphate-dependent enzyme [Alphaproteobacteria bacterium]|nr:aminotransferase class III-fold pyridoxal phosphate-dependent enzyme [Alphaproteobacteria bacterium]